MRRRSGHKRNKWGIRQQEYYVVYIGLDMPDSDILLTPGNRFKNDDSYSPLVSLFRLPLTPRWSRHSESLIELA